MMVTLQSAQAEGGDIRGMQSAALIVVPGQRGLPERENRIYDLRVDEHADPVAELARLVRLRGANLLDAEGHKAFDAGEREKALSLWEEARRRAPEMEEIAFWQAATLADKPGDVQTAAAILRPALAGNDRREHWLDLLRRLEACKLLERAGAAEELIQAL
jgi:tetratricopeptide (TPR) repeat protein